MKRPFTLRQATALASSILLVSACGARGPAVPEIDESTGVPQELLGLPPLPHTPLCAQDPKPGYMRCHAWVITDPSGRPAASPVPLGLQPADLQDAYKLDVAHGKAAVVAIVDAYDDPSAETDLAVYRAQFGLPPCTTANGCFRKVNQLGGSDSYPAGDSSWGGEISLDVDMVSAVCPQCRILLVEADSASWGDLATAVGTAVSLGATVISNSYGGPEAGDFVGGDSQFLSHPGVAVFASAGDHGYGALYPAASPFVTAVGGTSLVRSPFGSRGWTEVAWGHRVLNFLLGGTGSGCSKYFDKPSWQRDGSCPNRMVADVSAVADPMTGLAVYDTFGNRGWLIIGGTSAASPIVAGIYALTGHAGASPSLAHEHPEGFFDVKLGSNAWCFSMPAYFCSAGDGYDGPTGWGTPNGAVLERISP